MANNKMDSKNRNISVSIVILTYNRVNLLNSLLETLYRIKYSGLEIIVIDNCSTDDTELVIRERHTDILYLKTDSNIGVGARNLGLQMAHGDIIICLDDDVFGIDDDAIQNILDIFNRDSRIGAVNFKIVDFYNKQQCNWVHHCKKEQHGDGFFITYEITEGAVAFRKKALNEAGLYPSYFFLSHEGPDLAFRIMDIGYQVVYCGHVIVEHCHSDLGRKSWYSYYYDTRNQYWLSARNFPIRYMLKYLLVGQLSTLLYSLRDGYFRYWLKAVFDGMLGLPRALADRKVVSQDTINVIMAIDQERPSIVYMMKERIFKKHMRL